MRRTFKFETHPKGQKPKNIPERLGIWAAVPVCLAAYFMFGPGWIMIIASMLTYVIVRHRLERIRR